MKKIISIFLSLSILLSVIYQFDTVIASQVKANDIDNTIEVLSRMYDNNDRDFKNELYSSNTESVTIPNRIILKCDNPNINTYDSTESTYCFGYYFIQYSDDESAQYAFDRFEEQGYAPVYDSICTTQESEIYTQYHIANAEFNASSESSMNFDWAYSVCDINAALDYYKYKIKSEVVVAVIDSGINYNIDVFKNRVIRTYKDFSDDNSGDEMDKFGHGTAVSSIIAMCTPSNVKIECFKVSNNEGLYDSAILLALEYIIETDNKPDVINMSFSNSNKFIEEEIKKLDELGVVTVASAGNAGIETNYYPASYDSVISVAGVYEDFKPASDSSYGNNVDISAPFGALVYEVNKDGTSHKVYKEGTSFSAPIVASAAALVLMENKNYTPYQVKQEIIDTATPFKKSDCLTQYGAGVVNFTNIIKGTRIADVTSNYNEGVYDDDIDIELKCNSSLVDIIYTTDGTLPTTDNGQKYSSAISLSESTRIIAAAYPKIGSTLHSKFACFDYYINKNGESDFIIDDSGTVLGYIGNDADVVIPNEINGVVPTSIGKKCFQYTDINSITLPDSITEISEYAFKGTLMTSIIANGVELLKERCFMQTLLKDVYFPKARIVYEEVFYETPLETADFPELTSVYRGFYECNKLKEINIPNINAIIDYAFYGCDMLTCDLVAPMVKDVSNQGLAGSGFRSIILDNCNNVSYEAFEGAKAETIKLGKITTIKKRMFNNCTNLKMLYCPNVVGRESNCYSFFENCYSLNTVFIPNATSMYFDIPSNVTIYANKRLSFSFWGSTDYKYTFVSYPDDDLYNQIMNDNSGRFLFESVEDYAEALGAQIRVNNIGIRFGFSWDKFAELEDLSTSVNYGFVLKYSDSDLLNINQANKRVVVNNKTQKGDTTYFNLVLTNIPDAELDTIVSVRAYVNIDGMYFYSPITKRSYNQVVNAVLCDNEIDEGIKNSVFNLIRKGA